MLNYNHLYYFYIAAKSGGVTSAAKILRISQPSLSSQLKVLEAKLNLNLFRKVGRQNELTESGQIVYGFCRRMFEVSEELSEMIVERLPFVSRKLNVGISDQIERSFVVDILSFFLKNQHHDAQPKISVISASHDYLQDRLTYRELDAVITHLPLTAPDLENVENLTSPVSLFSATPDLKLKRTLEAIRPSDIQKLVGGIDAHWVKPCTSTKLRSETDLFFEKHQIKGRVVFESDMIASLTRSVMDGVGFGFLPTIYLRHELQSKHIFQIGAKNGYWTYKIWLCCHGQNHDDPLIKSFAKAFAEVGRKALIRRP